MSMSPAHSDTMSPCHMSPAHAEATFPIAWFALQVAIPIAIPLLTFWAPEVKPYKLVFSHFLFGSAHDY